MECLKEKPRNKTYPFRYIDAHGGLGQPVAMDAVDMVKSLARQRDISLKEGIPYSLKQIERLERLGQEIGLGKLEPCEIKATD